MAAISLFGDTNMAAVTSCEIQEVPRLSRNGPQAPKGCNKHLMTGPKGNSEFCFPETLNVPQGEAEGNIEVEGKQNSLFPEGPVIKCFLIPPNSK